MQDGTLMDRYVAATHASMAMLVGNSLAPFNFIERGSVNCSIDVQLCHRFTPPPSRAVHASLYNPRSFGTFTNFFGSCINAVLFGQVRHSCSALG